MRTREEMLVNVNGARLVYAWLTNPGNMLIIRLAQDMTNLLETVAEKDAEIERLKADLVQVRSAITKLSREIWKVC